MKQVVIVDDNRHVAEGVAAGVDWAAYHAEVAAVFGDGFQVLDYVKDHPVDLLVTDINMPGLSGLDMARQVLEQMPFCKIILISAYDDFDYARQAVRLGAFDYVEKPIVYGYLSEIVGKAVASLEQEAQNRELLRRSRPALVQGFFDDLLASPPEDSRYYLADSAEYLDIPTGYARYLCLVVRLVDDVALRQAIGVERFHMFMLALRNRLDAALEGAPYRIFLERRNEIVAVLGTDEEYTPLLRQVNDRLGKLLEELEEEGRSAIIGLGRIQESLWALSASFAGARQALQYRFYLPQKNLFDIRDFSAHGGGEVLFTKLKEETLVQLLLKKDEKGLRSYFDLLAEELARNMPGQTSIALFTSDITGRLLRFLLDLDIEAEALRADIQSFGGKLAGFSNLRALCGGLEGLCLAICGALADSTESYHKRLNKRIQEHIRANYSSGDLGLASIAASVNVSPAHLSALFKKMNGVNLTEAITDVRMEVAENLLRHSNLTVKEVSEKVGYANPYYFSASFKKKTGRNPSQYRQEEPQQR